MNSVPALISIVTPSYNQAAYLESTILSVLNQDYAPVEYLVIDGASTDNSAEIIRQYSGRIDYGISEPDQGQSQAINKGVAKAAGSLLTWINSDDMLLPGGVAAAARAHTAHPDAILLGDVVHFADDDKLAFLVHQHDVSLENLVTYWQPGWTWNQPGTFIPRSVWERVGSLDESLRYTFDREWMCRALRAGVPLVYLGQVVAAFRMHPGSKTMDETTRWGSEQLTVTQRYAACVPGLSNADIEAAQAMLEAVFRLSLLYMASWDASAARRYLLEARRTQPKIVLRRNFWQLWARSLAPRPLVRLARQRWLRSRRQADLLALVRGA